MASLIGFNNNERFCTAFASVWQTENVFPPVDIIVNVHREEMGPGLGNKSTTKNETGRGPKPP